MSTLEERLTRLEEGCYFQEAALKELNEALIQQQQQIDMLEKMLARSETKITALQAQLDQGPENSPPPHYMPERY
ncbi:MAG: SlyX family protein [Desulfovibrionaceae bacterium]|jgi:SlyX protein|nr:SlyX family protein [Desulfovibrionaceae bacterium]